MKRFPFMLMVCILTIVIFANPVPAQNWGVGVKIPPLHVFGSLKLSETFDVEGGFKEITLVPATIIGRPLGVYLVGKLYMKGFELEALPWPLRPFGSGGVFFAPVSMRDGATYLMGAQGSVGLECGIKDSPFTILGELGYGVTSLNNIFYGGAVADVGVRLSF